MKTSLIAALLIIIAFTSCTKTMDLVPQPNPATSTSPTSITLHEVNASDDFNWSTTKQIKFSFNGKDAQGSNLLLQVLDNEGNVIMQKMQMSDKSFQTDLKIPANYTTLVVSYGADSKNIDCTAGSVTMTSN